MSTPSKQALYQALLSLKTEEDCALFLEDLLTKKELDALAQRLHAAKLLIEGKTYEQIIKDTQISSTTLYRVSTCVRYGNGGYKRIIKK